MAWPPEAAESFTTTKGEKVLWPERLSSSTVNTPLPLLDEELELDEDEELLLEDELLLELEELELLDDELLELEELLEEEELLVVPPQPE